MSQILTGSVICSVCGSISILYNLYNTEVTKSRVKARFATNSYFFYKLFKKKKKRKPIIAFDGVTSWRTYIIDILINTYYLHYGNTRDVPWHLHHLITYAPTLTGDSLYSWHLYHPVHYKIIYYLLPSQMIYKYFCKNPRLQAVYRPPNRSAWFHRPRQDIANISQRPARML